MGDIVVVATDNTEQQLPKKNNDNQCNSEVFGLPHNEALRTSGRPEVYWSQPAFSLQDPRGWELLSPGGSI